MISVILGRASRGLTANPVMRIETGTASGARAGNRETPLSLLLFIIFVFVFVLFVFF